MTIALAIASAALALFFVMGWLERRRADHRAFKRAMNLGR